MATFIWHGGLKVYIANAETLMEARELMIDAYETANPLNASKEIIADRVSFAILVNNAPTLVIDDGSAEVFDLLKSVRS